MSRPEDNSLITLTLEGSKATRGVRLADFEGFIDEFLRALRDYDRDRRLEPTRKSGHPDRRAELITAFRLLWFEPGSGVATIEPEVEADGSDQALFRTEVPLPLENLRLLVEEISSEQPLPTVVVDALGRACRTLGDDGSISVELPESLGAGKVVVDRSTLEQMGRPADRDQDEVTSVSGRLHLVDLEPDRLAIRSSTGVEWACRYPEELESRVRALIGEVVWAAGTGKLTTSLRGAMDIDRIEAVLQGEQSQLFTLEPVPLPALLSQQEIRRPQGLDTLSDPDWSDDDSDEAYLAAIFGD